MSISSYAGPGCLLLALLWAACRHVETSQPKEGVSNKTFVGHATYFDALGLPYGGCGVPAEKLDSQHFVALNVQNTPGDYTSHMPRPLVDLAKVGAWDNGRNCGRWIRVSIAQNCVDGVNSGVPGSEFCAGGRYEDDIYSGASTDFVVADSCQDGNRWCRDDPYHLDLATAALRNFSKDGQRVADLKASGWSNRKVQWSYIDAPDYKGDISISFMQNAQTYWPAILVNHLPRGIHGVEEQIDGKWEAAKMNSDLGQSFILKGKDSYRIRIRDANDQLLQDGRIYAFKMPCSEPCKPPLTEVKYTVEAGKGEDSAAPAPAPKEASEKSPAPVVSKQPVTSEQGKLRASFRIKSAWDGGRCLDLLVENPGPKTVSDWALVVDLHGGKVSQKWNLTAKELASGWELVPQGTWSKSIAAGAKIENAGICVDGGTAEPSILRIEHAN